MALEFKDRQAKSKKPLRQVMRSERDDKTYKVYVRNPKTGNIKTIHFGDPNLRIKKDDPKAKKSYCARSKGIKGHDDPMSANYWSRKMWGCRN